MCGGALINTNGFRGRARGPIFPGFSFRIFVRRKIENRVERTADTIRAYSSGPIETRVSAYADCPVTGTKSVQLNHRYRTDGRENILGVGTPRPAWKLKRKRK